jgi:hypothetical protein
VYRYGARYRSGRGSGRSIIYSVRLVVDAGVLVHAHHFPQLSERVLQADHLLRVAIPYLKSIFLRPHRQHHTTLMCAWSQHTTRRASGVSDQQT